MTCRNKGCRGTLGLICDHEAQDGCLCSFCGQFWPDSMPSHFCDWQAVMARPPTNVSTTTPPFGSFQGSAISTPITNHPCPLPIAIGTSLVIGAILGFLACLAIG